MFPRELAEAVGWVVLEAAQCEDTLGELVILPSGGGTPHLSWWSSGEQLAAAIETIDDPDAGDLAARYRELSPQRNTIVHGLWLSGEGDGQYLNMRREKTTRRNPQPPQFEFSVGSNGVLASVAGAFRELEHRAAAAVKRFMGLR